MRAPVTIWRCTTRELVRLAVLTSVVLVTVIAFSITVQFYARGKLGPLDTLRFMGYAAVPMLTYALPFAAGFAATLVYHRLSQDNEAVGAYAGGIGHRSLLAPAAIVGLGLSVALGALNDQVIPRFLRSMERLVTEDLVKVMVGSIERGESLSRDNALIHADSVRRLGPDERSGATERLLLTGVCVLTLDEDGRIAADATASRAWAWYLPETTRADGGRGPGAILVRLENVVARTKDSPATRLGYQDFIFAAPDAFKDDPKFCTLAELRQRRQNPDAFNFVDVRRRDLAFHLAERQTTDAINSQLADGGEARLVTLEGEAVTIRAASIAWNGERWELAPGANGRIEAERLRNGPDGTPGAGGKVAYSARSAGLNTSIGPDRARRELTLRLAMEQVAVRSERARATDAGEPEAAGERLELAIDSLRLADDRLDELLGMPSRELLATEALPRTSGANADPFLLDPTRDLEGTLEKLEREITSKVHERIAMSVSCIVMMLAGAVTALRLGGSTPLTVYLWSFFPALGAVITIASGQQMVHELGWPGLPVLWGGIGLLSLYTFGAYRVLARH